MGKGLEEDNDVDATEYFIHQLLGHKI